MAKYGITSIRGYVYCYYHHQDSRFTISTRFQSEELFDPTTKSLEPRHVEYKLAKRVTDLITNNMITASLRVQTAGYEPTAHLVRQEYHKVLEDPTLKETEPKQSLYPDFWDAYELFMKDKAADSRPATYKNYLRLMKLLQKFEEVDKSEIHFEHFDNVMFGRFKQYMIFVEKFQDSTIDKSVRYLKTFYKWAVPGIDRSFMKFTPKLAVNPHPLSPEEFRYVIDYKIEGYMGKTKDLFVFCACTGMRYSDSQRFDKSWVIDGTIDYTQLKSSSKAMVPMLDTANKILVKYGFNTPRISNQKYNDYLKELFYAMGFTRYVRMEEYQGGEMIDNNVYYYQQVTSHTARQTFITYALSQGIPVQDVMKMSGHSDYRSMRPYVNISREHIKSQANKFNL